MEDELRVDAELWGEAETVWLVGLVLRELRAEADKGPVDPAEDVADLLGLAPVDGEAGEDHCGGLLVEAALDGAVVVGVGVPRPAERRGPEPDLPARVLVLGDELDEPALVLRERVLPWVRYFEVYGQCGRRIDAAEAARGAKDEDDERSDELEQGGYEKNDNN